MDVMHKTHGVRPPRSICYNHNEVVYVLVVKCTLRNECWSAYSRLADIRLRH